MEPMEWYDCLLAGILFPVFFSGFLGMDGAPTGFIWFAIIGFALMGICGAILRLRGKT